MVPEVNSYKTELWVDWCPGCGNFGILTAVTKALEELKLEPSRTVIVSGIGCSGKIAHFVNVNGVHTLHGRAIPFAMGIKLANPDLTVIVHGGDGDLLSIGGAHFVALGRRNLDVVVVMHDNGVYGLTKGQASPTLQLGVKTKSLAKTNIQQPVNPILLALASGYTFVARGYALDVNHLKEIFKKAITHRGAAFVDVLQPCVTFNDVLTADYYRKRIHKLEDEGGWDPLVKDIDDRRSKLFKAIEKGLEWDSKIYTGIFYLDNSVMTFEERLSERLSRYPKRNPSNSKIVADNSKPIIGSDNFEKIFKDFVVYVRKGG